MNQKAPIIRALCVMIALTLATPFAHIQYEHWRHHYIFAPSGVYGKEAMVVSAHRLASDVGRDVLAAGGNAFDAAVAVNFVLAVVYQQAGNIGGGGFMVYRLHNGTTGALDFREIAPQAAHRDMFLDESGAVIKGKSLRGALAVGVPGSVAGMAALHKRFGSGEWAALIAPSIKLARDGFVLTDKAARMFNRYQQDFIAVNRSALSVVKNTGWESGQTIRFPALANTLERIAIHGRDDFYIGETSHLLVAEMKAANGLITQEDLAQYKVVWRTPIRIAYRGYDIITMPPPSSGGVALSQLLQGIEPYAVSDMRHNSTQHIHLMTELERRAYADRATYLGDPDFVFVPTNRLTAPDYVRQRIRDIDSDKATDSRTIKEGNVERVESVETTHFSIVDKQGNAVSITTTLNGNFGSKLAVQGGGFFLNNEMDDFAIAQGHANQFGLLGNEQNAIAPAKRMLSSMTPTIIEKDGALRGVIGTPGGATIITSVFQTLLNLIDFEMSAAQAVYARKSHSQWQPDVIMMERGTLSLFNMRGLQGRGHKLYPHPHFAYSLGRVEAIWIDDTGTLEGAADVSRGFDDAAAGF
ncbi:MAG: gamma-glutamyltransferase [Alphaproteobacteria bacterium]|nr:gamma-glutamyltransferase [Alphaproteobacteria bacterium]